MLVEKSSMNLASAEFLEGISQYQVKKFLNYLKKN